MKVIEEFKAIKGYNNKYYISNLGRVFVTDYRGQKVWKEMKSRSIKGYLSVGLRKFENNKSIQTLYKVHRLVASAFIENPNNYPQVNHLDENPANNNYLNLEWCTAKYNINYGTRNERDGQKKSKPVRCIETGIVYKSGRDASLALGVHYSAISNVLRGKQKTLKGYHFELVNTK